MKHLAQYLAAALLGILGVAIIVCSQLKVSDTKKNYDSITAAMKANTSKKCTPINQCNSVAPATWKNNVSVAKDFYTPLQQDKPSSGGKWNINTGPGSHAWEGKPLPFYQSDPTKNFFNVIAITESANNLGNALGTLTERKKACKKMCLVGVALVVFSLLFVALGLLTE